MKFFLVVTIFMLSTISMAKEVIIVTDVNGLAISGAKVTGMSYSIEIKSVFTNAEGKAVIKNNIQKLKWVYIEKQDYEASHTPITGEWPLHVELHKQK